MSSDFSGSPKVQMCSGFVNRESGSAAVRKPPRIACRGRIPRETSLITGFASPSLEPAVGRSRRTGERRPATRRRKHVTFVGEARGSDRLGRERMPINSRKSYSRRTITPHQRTSLQTPHSAVGLTRPLQLAIVTILNVYEYDRLPAGSLEWS